MYAVGCYYKVNAFRKVNIVSAGNCLGVMEPKAVTDPSSPNSAVCTHGRGKTNTNSNGNC